MEFPKGSIKTGSCSLSKMLDLVSAKWAVEILGEIACDPIRTRKLLTCIPGLTMKILQQRLKELESSGMINRIDFNTLPRRVEYSITDQGHELLKILFSLRSLSAKVFQENCPFERQPIGLGRKYVCAYKKLADANFT